MNRIRLSILLGSFILLSGVTVLIWSILLFSGAKSEELKVSFLDVGQGDAIFIETPIGFQVLFDGGPNKSVLRQLGKEMSFWDRSIDMIIASHPDLDHIGGFPAVIDRFDVSYYVKSGVGADTNMYDAVESRVLESGVETMLARRGQVLELGGGVTLEILFPDRSSAGFERNLASIVAKLVYGDTSFLLTGDSPLAIEKYLVGLDSDSVDVDVLKLGHHGSKTSSGESFIGYTSPEYAIISAGEDNRYGHPHKEVTDRLDQFDITYFETSKEGVITFISDGETVWRK